jgi:hypothetical protein
MSKPTASYRMPKQIKRSLALIIDPQKRGEHKRMMIQADLASQIRVKDRKKNEPDIGGSGD